MDLGLHRGSINEHLGLSDTPGTNAGCGFVGLEARTDQNWYMCITNMGGKRSNMNPKRLSLDCFSY